MSSDTAIKYCVGILIGSALFYLTLVGKFSVDAFAALATTALGALGMHSAVIGSPAKSDSDTPKG